MNPDVVLPVDNAHTSTKDTKDGIQMEMSSEHGLSQVNTHTDAEDILPQDLVMDWAQVDPENVLHRDNTNTSSKDIRYGIQMSSEYVLSVPFIII